MHIIVTGGGTGGHIFPAIEIIKAFKKKDPSIQVTLVGNKNSLEEKIALKEKIDFFGIKTKQVLGKSFIKKFLALIYMGFAFINCLFFLLKNKPKAVVGVGGYISVPMVMAAFILRIKRFICEQNATPGLANKTLSHFTNAIFLSFESSKKYFYHKNEFILSGNPIREEFFKGNYLSPKESSLKILVCGGSLGAKILNEELPKTAKLVKEKLPALNLLITHQTGRDSIEKVNNSYKINGIEANVVSFIENMPQEFSNHNLLISRAGATTCAEICAFGMPSILIPYLFANAHQKDNALALVEKGAALMLEETKEFSPRLADMIMALYNNSSSLVEMSINAKNLAFPKASETITETILSKI